VARIKDVSVEAVKGAAEILPLVEDCDVSEEVREPPSRSVAPKLRRVRP